MKELVDQLIAEAIEEGFITTRKLPGRPRKLAPSAVRLDPAVIAHWPQWAESRQRCQLEGCKLNCLSYCPACAREEGDGPSAGFYCHGKGRDCMGQHHCKLAHMPA